MKSIRESAIFLSNKKMTERKSIVGAFSNFSKDIYRDKFWYPHEEMTLCVEMYNRNSFAQSAVNTMKDFIKGGDIVVKSQDNATKIKAQAEMERLDVDSWVDEVIENTIKTGNSYLEIDYEDAEWKIPWKCYPIADSSRIYINCDEFGLPKKKKVMEMDPITRQPRLVERRDEEQYYIQRLDAGLRNPKAQWYDMSYHLGTTFKKFRIYGIPINKRKMIHFKLNIGDTSVYGRSYLASALDDFETLKQIERSIAIIAKYKAVPRDIIMYGDKDNPATDDELDEFIIYLESLEKDESAIVNKPIKRESLAYAGQDINLDYMINHIRKKIIAGIAPDFMMGLGDSIQQKTAQITLISYILAIYTKRKLFLKPIEEFFLKPFLRRNGLKSAHLEFGELDFETKSEKTNRIGALWTQNVLTFNETREMLSMPGIGKNGDVYYMEWQQGMMSNDSMGMGMTMPQANDAEEGLPNGEPVGDVFNHNPPSNRLPFQQGGKMPFDPYQKPTNVPKLIPKSDLGGHKMPERYNLDSSQDFISQDFISQGHDCLHYEKTSGRLEPDSDFDPGQLRRGQKVEMEHTDDEDEAKMIAKDHLAEFSDYYTRLKKMEDEAKTDMGN